MLKLTGKIILMLVIVTVSSLVLSGLTPDFWGHKTATNKYAYWEKSGGEYNTVFVGSSRIYRHVIPARFDSICGDMQLKSFNFGVNSFPAPQTYILVNKLLENPRNLKHIFLELSPVLFVTNKKLLHTMQGYYWYNNEQLKLMVQYIKAMPSLGRLTKWNLIKEHVLGWYEKKMFVGGAHELLSSALGKEEEWVTSHAQSQQGFVSQDQELESGPQSKEAKKIHAEFLKDVSIVKKRIQSAHDYFETKKKVEAPSVYTDYLLHLSQKARSKGIQLHFIIPPRLESYVGVSGISQKIPKGSILNMASPEQHPDFYKVKYSFDKGHLNEQGAVLFTNSLAETFMRTTNQP